MITSTIAALLGTLATSLTLSMNPPASTDYTSIPPDPAEVEQTLSAAKVSLAQAIEAAEKAAAGTAVDARAVLSGTLQYEVSVAAGGMTRKVMVDAQTGVASAPTLTMSSAMKIATGKHDGFVRSAAFDFTADPAVAKVMVYAGSKAFEVVINANDGTVISDTEKPRFPGEAFTGEIVELPSGLKYVDLKEGTGATPQGRNSNVKVHYSGWLTDGTKFDSSVDRGQPAQFMLGGVIAGWTEGVGGMKIGGKRKLIIPFALAYGDRGRPPVIPAKATLIFDVELLEVTEPAAAPGGQ